MKIKDVEFRSMRIERNLCDDARTKGRESRRGQLENKGREIDKFIGYRVY